MKWEYTYRKVCAIPRVVKPNIPIFLAKRIVFLTLRFNQGLKRLD
jgi:hypothetical protein